MGSSPRRMGATAKSHTVFLVPFEPLPHFTPRRAQKLFKGLHSHTIV